MDGSGNSPSSSGLDTNELAAEKIKPEASKKRKVIHKAAVVTVMKVESSSTSYVKHKSEGPPLDSWSWRKYGQKPIKGSPFPRGYYRCSTSKGCSAKKQVERCKTDSSMIIITYTSDHNHPCPHDLSSSITNPNRSQLSELVEDQELPITPKKEYQDPERLSEEQTLITSSTTDEEEEEQQQEETHIFHYLYSPQSPFNSSLIIRDDEDPFGENLLDKSVLDFDGEPDHLSLDPSDGQLLLPTATSDQENDGFFNELEELPIFTSSSFSRFMRRSLFDHERILVHPS